MRLQPGAEIAVGAGLAQARRHCCRRYRDRPPTVDITGSSAGSAAGLLERRGQFAGLDLGGLDVGLVERIDAEHRAGDRGRHLEAEELLADMVDRFHDDAHDGMAGLFQRGELVVMRGVVFAFGPDVDEEAVVAVERRHRPAVRRRSGSGPCLPCRWIPRSAARPRRRNRRSSSTTGWSPCRGRRGRRGPSRARAARPDFHAAARPARRSAPSKACA